MTSTCCLFCEGTLWLLHLKPQLHELWYNGAAGETATEQPPWEIRSTENKNEWSQPCFPSALFQKAHPPKCKGMDSTPEQMCLLALLTYVILEGTVLTQRGPCEEAPCFPPLSEMRVLARGIKNPTLHASMFLWNGTREGKLPIRPPC